MKLLYMILYLMTQRVNPSVNCEFSYHSYTLTVAILVHHCSKCITLMEDVNNRGNCGRKVEM